MPKMAGVNLLAWSLAALVIFFVGFIWYGVLFLEPWQAAVGVTTADYEGQSGIWMLGYLVIALLISFGIGRLRQRLNVYGLMHGLRLGLYLALLISVPVLAYDLVALPNHSIIRLAIDAGHSIIGFTLAGAVHALFD